ncbi:MAG: glucoamylase family protein [Longimicrobiales bacterium]
MRASAAVLLLGVLAGACAAPLPAPPDPAESDVAFLDSLQYDTFRFFWETTNPANGMVPDRWPTESFASIAAIGFGLTAYPVGAERGWITRAQAAARTLNTLRFFWTAPQGEAAVGVTGHRGFFYHFLDMQTGERFQTTELSTIDTGLLMMGVLFAQQYFDGAGAVEAEIRALADSLYRRVEWDWAVVRQPEIVMAWRPERGFGDYDYDGYDEAMFLYVLALGSPTHPVEPESWTEFTSTNEWLTFYGQEHVNFAPLFGHQYSHVWIDFRGIQDAYMRGRGIDYFENSRRATIAQRAYAIANPNGWIGYGENLWGLTASDGPGGFSASVSGRDRQFHGYWARGAAAGDIRDDGTLVPTAVGGSIPFAPDITIAALREMHRRWGMYLYDEYGFKDSFNLTLAGVSSTPRGRVVPGVGWFNDDYLGIDQGPIVLMIENHRTEFIWDVMKESPYIVRGLCRASFTGAWIAGRCE